MVEFYSTLMLGQVESITEIYKLVQLWLK